MIKQKFNLTSLLVFALVIVLLSSAVFMAKLAGIKLGFPEQQQAVVVIDNSQLSTPEPIIDGTIKFDVEKAKVGDKLGSMTITKLNGGKSDIPTAIPHEFILKEKLS